METPTLPMIRIPIRYNDCLSAKSTIPQGFSLCSNEKVSAYLCGDFLEAFISPSPIAKGLGVPDKHKTKEPESQESLLERSVKRSQRTVRRLCNSNRLYVLHTLTYAVSHPKYFEGERPFDIIPVEKQKDREVVLEHWKQFARKMRDYEQRKGRDFKYIAVIEKHTGKRALTDRTIKKDTYHIHFLSDRVHKKRLMQHKWRKGLCNFSDWNIGVKDNDLADKYSSGPPDNPGAYASKYLGKDMSVEYKGRKRYWASRNLIKPFRVSIDEFRALTFGAPVVWEHTNLTEIEGRVFKTLSVTFKVDVSATERKQLKPTSLIEKRDRKRLLKYRERTRKTLLHMAVKEHERNEEQRRIKSLSQRNHRKEIESTPVDLKMPGKYSEQGIRAIKLF